MSSLENFCSKSIRVLFYLLFFFTPIIMWTKTSEVFEFNKMLFVYLVTVLISAFWVIKSLHAKKFIIARTPIDIPIMLFFTSQIISTFLSIDRHTSLWGYYSRFHGGLMSTISYLILFYAFVTHIGNDKKTIQRIIYSIVASSALVSIYGILEHFGIDKHVWVQDVQSRVFSTLGQPNWLSAYLLAVLPIPITLIFTSKTKLYQIAYAISSFLIFLTILYTKSRSGIGATLIIAGLLIAISLIKTFQGKHSISKKIVFGTIVAFVSTIFFIGTPWTPTPSSIKHNLEYGGPVWPAAEKYLNKIGISSQIKPVQIEKLSELDKENLQRSQQGLRVGGSNSMDIRKIVWQGAIELSKKYPLFGTGVDTFGYSYYWVRPASHNLLSEWDFLYNRAHNEYLNFAATTGFFGLISYLVMIGSFIYIFYISIKQKHTLAFPALIGFISILITNYFGFSVVCVAILFFLLPAIIISESSQFQLSSHQMKFNFGLGTFLVCCAALYLVLGIYKTWTADLHYASGKTGLIYGPSYLNDSLVSLEKAATINKKEPLYLSQLSEAQAQVAMYINEELKTLPASTSADVKLQYQNARDFYAKSALTNASTAITMNPHQTNYHKTKAKVGLYLATFDPNHYNDVINSLLKVSEKAPTDAKVLYNIGLVYLNMQKPDDAKRALQKAIELKPDYYEAIAKLSIITSTESAKPKK